MPTLEERYFNWMENMIFDKFHQHYKKLLRYLNTLEFTYLIDIDGNRECDGIDLRYQFAYEMDIPQAQVAKYLDNKPCSVLEMMIALSQRINNIMEDPEIEGEQIPDWFWSMIRNLGLDDMGDAYFDKFYVKEKIDIFLQRKYKPDGTGGLFVLRDRRDLRGVEIWMQAMWYLDEVMSERR